MASLCQASSKKAAKAVKHSKGQTEVKEQDLLHFGFVGASNIPQLSEALLAMKTGSDSKLQKNGSLSRLSHSVGPKKKFDGQLGNPAQTAYKYAILAGNNQELVKRVMAESTRAKYWVDMTHLCLKPPNTMLLTSSKAGSQSVPRKFVAGNIMAHSNINRPSSPLQVHFKWTPVSIKSDFTKLQSNAGGQYFNTYGSVGAAPAQGQLTATLRPRNLVNHFEFHKELTRKDDLVTNLRTQL